MEKINKSISVVTTVFNTKQYINELVYQIENEVSKISDEYEIILVDDNCPQESWEIIEENCLRNKKIKAIKLSKNAGQQIAMSAGISKSTKDYVIILDGDLQNPINEFPTIIDYLHNGKDIVYTISSTRNNMIDKITSKFFWYVITKILGVKIVKNQLMMKGFNKKIANLFSQYSEHNRTIAGVINDIGFTHEIIEVKNQKRKQGKSNYNFFQRFDLMLNIIISITNRPISLLIYFSLFIFLLSIIFSVYTLYNYIVFDVKSGFTSTVSLISFFGSTIILMLGFTSKYLASIYEEVKRRPLFHIEHETNFD